MTSNATPRSALVSALAAPADPQTYRALAYVILSVPLAIAYLVLLAGGFSLTLGFGVTILGPVALLVTLLAVLAATWFDLRLTSLVLGVPLSPTLPETGDGLLATAKGLLLSRTAWLGAAYLLWRFVLGTVALVIVATGASILVAAGLVALGRGEHVVVGSTHLASLGRPILVAVAGLLAGLATLYAAALAGWLSAAVASALFGTSEPSADAA